MSDTTALEEGTSSILVVTDKGKKGIETVLEIISKLALDDFAPIVEIISYRKDSDEERALIVFALKSRMREILCECEHTLKGGMSTFHSVLTEQGSLELT